MRRRWLSCRRSSGQVERRRRPRRMQAVHAAGFARLYAVYKNYLARPKCSHRAGLVLDVPEQCCGVCLSTLTDRGSASCSLVLTIAGTILDRGRNARARPTSISRPLCGVQEFLAATAGARAIPCRTPSAPSSPDGTPRVRRQNQRGAEKVGNLPATLPAVRCLNFGGRSRVQSKTLAEIAEIAGSAGRLPQQWIPDGGDQRFGLQCLSS